MTDSSPKDLFKSTMLLKTYTSNWIKDFTDIKLEIESGLHGLDFTIEHVGSTAVPHLDSKPIIDIDIIYSKNLDFVKIKSGLEKIGYYHNGNQGVDGRDVFKRNGKLTNKLLDTVKHHLYVCPIDSVALERHILTRNFLRKNEWARLQYQQMKYALAEKANQDRKVYSALKELNVNDFIDLIVKEEKQTHHVGFGIIGP
ncbi:GrpB family protein [Fibrella aquatilis]|uniref:GrpB family protein n=1 Tax=Fibrella aquatilis TaxID=2817059 RepID=A0A939G410_9BACT|nr:GrpB family protein [Fibrella aquatilis]MBO0929586.1 GrpB family protein [Fibrella aquatilis]